MSALYNLEPQPTAKVLLETTSGDILLELFAKQIPLASRNFLQLCLDGYYDNTIFHRLVPGFVVQGGDPTGTGEGGGSIYDGGVFEDEFHSRLKFNRRGLLGMANTGRKNDNGSQFFFTLAATPELEGKNTMFGRVVGDTIYNLMKIGEAELIEDGNERPLYPTTVTGSEVLVNPFEDMVRRDLVGKRSAPDAVEKKEAKKRGKKKGGKTLLSFEAEEGEDSAPILKKEKFNSELVSADTVQSEKVNGIKEKVPDPTMIDTISSSDTKTEKSVRKKVDRSPSAPSAPIPPKEKQLPLPDDEQPSRTPTSSPETEQVGKVSSLLDRTNAQIAELKASMKRNVSTAPAEQHRKKSALEQMIPKTATRGRKRKHGINGSITKDTLDILNAFREKLESAPRETARPATSTVDDQQAEPEAENGELNKENDEDEAALCDLHFIANCQSCQSWDKHLSGDPEVVDDSDVGWMSHALNFDKDRLGKDLNWRKKNEDDLMVIDPREKAKDIKEQQRAKRQKGPSGGARAWDRDRGVPDRRVGDKGSTTTTS